MYWTKRECPVTTIVSSTVFNGYSDEVQKRLGELLMNSRMVDPYEIANVVMFLRSGNTRCMTGQVVNVDGDTALCIPLG